ncbi:hypothetical protein [Gottfriedia solisilvae]|uniref:hypothetical protein n=1 Tax=Gottfriedia solisilvae TaxID=1516104 RepID=UPI003D2F2ECE
MSNVRTVKTSNYVQLHNKAGLDKELSSKAKGILYTAMALPGDYDINKSTFHTFFKDGRDSIKAGIEELVLAGYGFHEQLNTKGKFHAITLISDVKLTTLAKLDPEELETFVAELSDELLYALERIRETGKTYIGKLHDESRKSKKAAISTVTENPLRDSVTENPSRQIGDDKSVGNKKELQNGIKRIEEEEDSTYQIVDLNSVIDLMNNKIAEREITNAKTIKAILDQANKCKAIGSTDHTAVENYVVMVVEDKMSKFGQHQKQNKQRTGTSNKPIRKEIVPDWYGKDESIPTNTNYELTPETITMFKQLASYGNKEAIEKLNGLGIEF